MSSSGALDVPGSSRPATPPTRPALRADEAAASSSTTTTTTSSAAATTAQTIPPSITNVPAASRSKIVPTIVQDGVRVVPPLFELCQVDDLINLIAHMLDRLIQHNDRIPLTPNALTRFHSRAPPAISVRDYLLRIAKYTNVEPCCLLMLLPYVDKVCSRLSTFTISSLTVHRFVIACISVGSKALSDAFCTNGRYARVGGVSIAEMNLLEKELCEAIDWRLTTSGQTLAHYYTSLVKSHPAYRLAQSSSSVAVSNAQPAASSPLPIPERGPALIPPRVLLATRRNSTASNLPSPVGNGHGHHAGTAAGSTSLAKGATPASSSSSSISSAMSSSIGSSSLASSSAHASPSSQQPPPHRSRSRSSLTTRRSPLRDSQTHLSDDDAMEQDGDDDEDASPTSTSAAAVYGGHHQSSSAQRLQAVSRHGGNGSGSFPIRRNNRDKHQQQREDGDGGTRRNRRSPLVQSTRMDDDGDAEGSDIEMG